MSKVVFADAESYQSQQVDVAVKQLFDSLGGVAQFVKPNAKVFLKVNLVRDMNCDKAGTTHPSVVNAIAKLLKQETNADVTVGDSSGGVYTAAFMKTVYKTCGLVEGAEKGFYKLNDDFDFSKQPIGGKVVGSLDLTNSFLSADAVINVGKLKTHSFTGYSGAAKNLYGLVPGLVKVEMHSSFPVLEDFCDLLCDINAYAKNKIVLNVIDAIVGMEGAGPTNGKPRFIGKLFAGVDAFETDYVAVSVFADPMTMPLLQKAQERGLFSPQNVDFDAERLRSSFITDYDTVEVSRNGVFLNMPQWLKRLASTFLTQKVVMDAKKCKRCGKCRDHCPAKAITIGKTKAVVDYGKCIRCFCCQELCPFDAVKIKKSVLLKAVRGLSHTKKKENKS